MIMELWRFVKPLGIITYVLILLTLIGGLFRWKLKYHKMLAISALILASIHALIVILSH